MSYKVTDKRGKSNGDDSNRLTDDEIVAVMTHACYETALPIPKTVLMQQGVNHDTIERLFKEDRIRRVPVADKVGNITYHYYPASFDAYRVSNAVKGSDELKKALDDERIDADMEQIKRDIRDQQGE